MSFPHWQYFIAIESDLEKTTRYVEIAEGNFCTYSVEYARIILSASSEVDVISKLICQRINPQKQHKYIDDYRDCITTYSPSFPSFEITIPRYGLVRQPWIAWEKQKSPTWWRSYNDIKHQRNIYFEKANLETALDSVAGLFCLELAYNHNLLEKFPWTKLLHVEETMLVDKAFKFK